MMPFLLIALAGANPVERAPDFSQCRNILSKESSTIETGHDDITAADLIRLRDLVTIPSSKHPPYAISPDGRMLAIDIQQADPVTNSHCVAVAILDLKARGHPKIIFQNGEAIPEFYSRYGLSGLSLGNIANQAVSWSPDGKWIGNLIREKGVTQIRITKADGSQSFTLTRSPTNIEDYAWSEDSKSVIWASRVGLVGIRKLVEEEAKLGLHYDFRTMPVLNVGPGIDSPLKYFQQNIDRDDVRPASSQLEHRIRVGDSRVPESALSSAISAKGAIAFFHRDTTDYYYSKVTLHVRSQGTKEATCSYEECKTNLKEIWWSPEGNAVLFLRREGWNDSETALYRWNPRSSRQPRRLWATENLLEGCELHGARLICAYENSTSPRRLVWVDQKTGSTSLLFDPNPEFSRLRLGTVKRLKWKNEFGLEAFGDLVLPPTHKAGERHPLIIVQYRSRGFLRGGTGDEYPIFALAARGYAVFSIDRPRLISQADKSVRTIEQASAVNDTGLADRLNVHSALLKGLDLVGASGAIDSAKIGITGFSDGSATVQFGLINSQRFSVGVASNCCDDKLMISSVGGPMRARLYEDEGGESAVAFDWKEDRRNSYVAHARCWRTPLLFQLPGNEYRYALRSLAAFIDSHATVDTYIFPDEYHIKSQPVHKLAVYERNIDWFDFWFRGVENPSPGREVEYARWRNMRASLKKPKPQCSPPN